MLVSRLLVLYILMYMWIKLNLLTVSWAFHAGFLPSSLPPVIPPALPGSLTSSLSSFYPSSHFVPSWPFHSNSLPPTISRCWTSCIRLWNSRLNSWSRLLLPSFPIHPSKQVKTSAFAASIWFSCHFHLHFVTAFAPKPSISRSFWAHPVPTALPTWRPSCIWLHSACLLLFS